MKKMYLIFSILIAVFALAVYAADYPLFPKSIDSDTTNCKALSETSAQYTLPRAGTYYYVLARGNTAYILGGSNPTATAAVNGHFAAISDGAILGPIRFTSAKIAYIGDTGAGTAGEVCFIRLDYAP